MCIRDRDLLSGLADHSPYLWRLAFSDPERLAALLEADPDTILEQRVSALYAACDAATDETELMHRLRKSKQEMALLIALADIGGLWDVVQVTRGLSLSADAFVSNALRFLPVSYTHLDVYKRQAQRHERGHRQYRP